MFLKQIFGVFLTLVSLDSAVALIAKPQAASLEQSHNCDAIIRHFEQKYGIPEKLLSAVAHVESRKNPWAVYGQKRSRVFSNKESAIVYIQKLQEKGIKNINVGCMQINLQSHHRQFKTIADVLTPYRNIEFGAKLMRKLFDLYGSWESAVKHYHSASAVHNVSYKHKVFARWATAKGEAYCVEETAPQQLVAEEKYPMFKVLMGPGSGLSKKRS